MNNCLASGLVASLNEVQTLARRTMSCYSLHQNLYKNARAIDYLEYVHVYGSFQAKLRSLFAALQ